MTAQSAAYGLIDRHIKPFDNLVDTIGLEVWLVGDVRFETLKVSPFPLARVHPVLLDVVQGIVKEPRR